MSAVAYVLNWFPLNETLIRDREFLDFNKKEGCSFSNITTFVKHYPKLLPFSHKEMDRLGVEFLKYQSLLRQDVPPEVWENDTVREVCEGNEKTINHRIDMIWGHLSVVILPGLETSRFLRLSKVAKVALTIPHSNVAEERVFSVIRKIKRDDGEN